MKGVAQMTVIRMDNDYFDVTTYLNVSNIAYNSGTNQYTITYGQNNTTVSFSAASFKISVLWK